MEPMLCVSSGMRNRNWYCSKKMVPSIICRKTDAGVVVKPSLVNFGN